MLTIAGAKKSRADIKIWPWARGYETALKEKNTVLFSTTRTEARENLFKWVGPIMPSRIVLVAKKTEHQAKNKTIQANSGVSVAKMLHADRVDMWAYGAPVIMRNLKELGYPTGE
jgi:polar amino acid transport system substrate-binding protein